jgi:hypothetical protein
MRRSRMAPRIISLKGTRCAKEVGTEIKGPKRKTPWHPNPPLRNA